MMKFLNKKFVVFFVFLLASSVNGQITKIEIGEISAASSDEIQLKLIARKQRNSVKTKSDADVYDTAINSPKSVVFSKDGKKFYVHSLEGHTTAVYNSETKKKIKEIQHVFSSKNDSLFLKNENTVFDYKYVVEGIKEYNHFSGKPVESCLSHDGKYLWVTYYRRSFDSNAQCPSALAIIDTERDVIVRVMPTGPLPKMIACSPDNKFVAVTHWGDNTVGIIDVFGDDPNKFKYIKHCIVDNKVDLNYQSKEKIDRDNNCGNCLRGTTFTPDGGFLLVGKMGGNGGIMVFDTRDFSTMGTVSGMYTNVRHIVIKDEFLYLSANGPGFVQKCSWREFVKFRVENEGKTVAFKDWTNIYVGKGARTISLTPDGKYLFAAVNNESKVVAVRTSDMTIVATIKADSYPVGMAMSPVDDLLIVTSQGKSNAGGNSVMLFDVIRKKE